MAYDPSVRKGDLDVTYSPVVKHSSSSRMKMSKKVCSSSSPDGSSGMGTGASGFSDAPYTWATLEMSLSRGSMPSPALAISSRSRAQTQGPSSCAKNRLRADVSSPISTLVQGNRC